MNRDFLNGTFGSNTTQTPLRETIGELNTSERARDVAKSISALAPKLDLLFNNAGILLDGVQMSPDELEMHTQVNLITPYILMQALKLNFAQSRGAIINVS